MVIKNPVTRIISQIYLQTIRIMPPLVLLFIAYFGVTRMYSVHISPEASAIIVFTIWGTAEMGDLVRGAIESIPKIQIESATALALDKKTNLSICNYSSNYKKTYTFISKLNNKNDKNYKFSGIDRNS